MAATRRRSVVPDGAGGRVETLAAVERLGRLPVDQARAVVLAVIGAIVMIRAMVVETADGEPIGQWAWKPLVLIILANFVFGILLGGMPSQGIPAMGLIAAIFGLTFLSALAGSEFKFIEVLILAIVLAVGSWAAFVWGLNLQFQVWPSFISG